MNPKYNSRKCGYTDNSENKNRNTLYSYAHKVISLKNNVFMQLYRMKLV